MFNKSNSEKSRLAWLKSSACLPGKSLHVAVALIFLECRQCPGVTKLSNKHVAQFGVGRNGKYRALKWLEGAGLIKVKRIMGSSPEIQILDGRGGI